MAEVTSQPRPATAYLAKPSDHNIDVPTASVANDDDTTHQISGSKEADSNAGKPVYKVWQGKSKFWCGGNIMTGPDLRNLLTTFTMLSIPTALFIAFPGQDFINWGYDSSPGATGSWATTVCAVLYVLSVALLLTTALVDPGIIPPNPIDENTYHFRPRIQDVVVNGVHTQLKYCDTCNITRPPRAIHCSICNQCMDTFDHHCPWIGTCVARHNYRSFYMFIHVLTAYACFIIAATVWHQVYMSKIYLYRMGYSDGLTAYAAVLARNPITLIVCVYAFIGLIFVLGLVGFHNFLVCTGQTTNEQLKHQYPHGSPNSHGICANFMSLFCSVPAAHLDASQTYQPNKAAYKNTTQHVDVKYMDNDRLQKLAERAYDSTSTPSNAKAGSNGAASQTRRDSASNNGWHTRNASMQPLNVETVYENGNEAENGMTNSGYVGTPRNRGSPAHKNAVGMTVEPILTERTGPTRHHQRTPSLSIVVPDVVPQRELVDRSVIQSPLHERGPSISQVNLYTPMNGQGGNHSYDQTNGQTAEEDNAIRERSVFQSPLLHSRNNSMSVLQNYVNSQDNGSPHHHRRTSSNAYSSQGSPNRRVSVNGSTTMTPRSAEAARRQSLTPTNEARATFMSPEAAMPVNGSRRASLSTQVGQLPVIPDQPSELNI